MGHVNNSQKKMENDDEKMKFHHLIKTIYTFSIVQFDQLFEDSKKSANLNNRHCISQKDIYLALRLQGFKVEPLVIVN